MKRWKSRGVGIELSGTMVEAIIPMGAGNSDEPPIPLDGACSFEYVLKGAFF
jgi:hypothetical protein